MGLPNVVIRRQVVSERCDPQSVGLPNVAIRRQVVSERGPQSVRYAIGVTHSQWVYRTL